MSIWELFLIIIIQIFQVPYFLSSEFSSLLFLSKLTISSLILILFVCLYILDRNLTFAKIKIEIFITHAIIILKIVSIVLFSGPSSCSICDFYCTIDCVVDNMPMYVGISNTLSDGFVLSAIIIFNARYSEERIGNKRYEEVKLPEGRKSEILESTPRAHKVMAELIQDTIVSNTLNRNKLKNSRMISNMSEKDYPTILKNDNDPHSDGDNVPSSKSTSPDQEIFHKRKSVSSRKQSIINRRLDLIQEDNLD
ncbi:hypothetical protein SteCoe_32492 [Stentor coeruleus]|uniref:Uncharacterized protein n=1 Tax=Stentor coeruleus TaxID=5963 RepID=A0A1R2AYT8_9CILI|nr:hypothetical protein SteCoe_32492 [Stentor coeruleus]